MVNNEIFVHAEGALRFVQASASGGGASGARVWATASAPVSGTLAYVESFSFTSGQTIQTIMDRGVPTHHKVTQRDAIQVTFNCLYTGDFMAPVSASGATVPMWHLEFEANDAGNGNTGRYVRFHGVAVQSMQFTENPQGDTLALTCVALGMLGPTGTGYLG